MSKPSTKPGIRATQPKSVWARPLKFNGWGLFKSVAQIAGSLFTAEYDKTVESALEAVQCIKFKDRTDGELAWALVSTAMTKAIVVVLREISREIGPQAAERIQHAMQADKELQAIGVALDRDFFDHPGWSIYAHAVTKCFRSWLIALGVSDGTADNLAQQVPKRYTEALDREWLANQVVYLKLLPENRRTPFSEPVGYENLSARYAAWLESEANRRLFEEPFGLASVYIPLRAYVQTRKGDGSYVTTVNLAENLLDSWLEKRSSSDAVRVVEGDPGAGKSSLARRYAAERYGRTIGTLPWKIVYAPLHDDSFATATTIEGGVEDYTTKVLGDNGISVYPSGSNLLRFPLDRNCPYPTLLILDGLDELHRAGEFGRDLIRNFMSQVTALLKAWNTTDHAKLLVLICGRPIATDAIKFDVRADGSFVNLLPYLVNQTTVPQLFNITGKPVDTEGRLNIDQRAQWYENYASARGLTNGAELYEQVKSREDLNTITAQPLLNYLVAYLARESDTGQLPENLCTVYETLLRRVWQRGWDRGQVPAVGRLEFEPFCQLLETIAISAWHSGNSRSIRLATVEEKLSNQQKLNLCEFEKEVKSGVLRLLFAFFIRPGQVDRGDQTYEFTHKTFAEYLVVRRLAREIDNLAEDWKGSGGGGRNWSDAAKLQEWALLFGPTAIDHYVRSLLERKLATDAKHMESTVSNGRSCSAADWQSVLAHLLNAAVRDGMPMHDMTTKLKPLPTYQEMDRQALNSEIALLHALNACFAITGNMSRIPALEIHPGHWMGGRWMQMIQGSYTFADCSNVNWSNRNLYKINLSGFDLRGAILVRAFLMTARLDGANLEGSRLTHAALLRAELGRTILRHAYLDGAILNGAYIVFADLTDANLTGADLTGANLSNAILEGANLGGANLTGANLNGAILTGVINWTAEQFLLTFGDPKTLPNGKSPKKNWRTALTRSVKKSQKKPKPDAKADDSDMPPSLNES